jgi:hypothetical protein
MIESSLKIAIIMNKKPPPTLIKNIIHSGILVQILQIFLFKVAIATAAIIPSFLFVYINPDAFSAT